MGLNFLAGHGGETKPVIPGPDIDEEKIDDDDWKMVPWRDIAELRVSSMPACVPQCGAAHVPNEAAATRALVCAGPTAGSKEVEELAASCTFYSLGSIREDARDYFSLAKGDGRMEPLTPYVIICANPIKKTI